MNTPHTSFLEVNKQLDVGGPMYIDMHSLLYSSFFEVHLQEVKFYLDF